LELISRLDFHFNVQLIARFQPLSSPWLDENSLKIQLNRFARAKRHLAFYHFPNFRVELGPGNVPHVPDSERPFYRTLVASFHDLTFPNDLTVTVIFHL